MSTELDLIHDGEIAVPTPKPGTTAAALAMLRGHAEMMSAAHQVATAMVGTQMVPAAYRGKPDDAAAAILYGAELGLNPIQSLQQVFPVHGQPSIYARTMVALLKARGFRFRTDESTDTSVTVTGTSPSSESETSTWTIDRADRAGYTTNKKYESDPQAMLYAKACAEVCRKLAPDVLLGISHTREDLELDPPEPIRATARRLDTDPGARGVTVPPTVQQWADAIGGQPYQAAAQDRAHETVSKEVEKPDTAQVDEPPKRTKRADLDEAVALMDQIEGLETQDKRRIFVRTLFENNTATAATLTAEQRAYLLTELRGVLAQQQGIGSVADATDTEHGTNEAETP